MLAVYFGLSPLFDVDWYDQDLHIYVLYLKRYPHGALTLTINGESVPLDAPNPIALDSRLRTVCRVWESTQQKLASLKITCAHKNDFEHEYEIEVGPSTRPTDLDTDGLVYITEFLGNQPPPRRNWIYAIRPPAWCRQTGIELLFPHVPDIGKYQNVAEKVEKLGRAASLNLAFAALHHQLDAIDQFFLERSLPSPEGCLDCNINIDWQLLESFVQGYEPFALRRLLSSDLSFHCVLELTGSLNDARRVEKAIALTERTFMAKAQDDSEPSSPLYAFRDLVKGLIWVKVPQKIIADMAARSDQARSDQARSTADLICRSAQLRGHGIIFEGVNSAEYFNTLVSLIRQGSYLPQSFLIQVDPEYAANLDFLDGSG